MGVCHKKRVGAGGGYVKSGNFDSYTFIMTIMNI